MNRIGRVLCACFALLLIARPSSAQAPPEPPPRLEASAQFTFLGTTGNASTRSLGTGGDLIWRSDPWTHTAKAVFAQNETDDELKARALTALYRAGRSIGERLSTYGQYDFLRDAFAGVEQRHVGTGGISYLAVSQPRQKLRIDGGIGYLYERRPVENFDSATLTTAAEYRFTLSPTSEISFDPRILYTLADADAWRYDQVAALTASLTSILSLKLSHTVRYSADPAPGFETTDTIAAISLVARVRRPQ